MIYILIFIVSFAFMEFVAWFAHKYVMHGFLWVLHRDHHIKPGTYNSFFEKNDYFFLIFAVPAIILIFSGLASAKLIPVIIGAGISLYGFTYFAIHEILIHSRLPVRIPLRGKYIEALIRAHQAHHAPKSKDEFLSFGLLVFPRRFFSKE
jgi:beta-carotene 3-hydroxylase